MADFLFSCILTLLFIPSWDFYSLSDLVLIAVGMIKCLIDVINGVGMGVKIPCRMASVL